MRGKKISIGLTTVLAIAALILLVTGTRAVAQAEKLLHSFNDNGKDGYESFSSGLAFDASGNVYGATYIGGVYNYGTVFELTPKAGGGWAEKVLHSFNNNGKDGAYPYASLIFDGASNLYGTTQGGGAHDDGAVFELSPKAGGGWVEKILHSFNGTDKDGFGPNASLIFDDAGNLYGTTVTGGAYSQGTVFELSPKAGGGWAEKILHDFNDNGEDGTNPLASLVFDTAGNLYGTTADGGTGTCSNGGCGTAFELTPTKGGGWAEKILHNFDDDGKDGAFPTAGLIFDVAGNLYGTTEAGGSGACSSGGYTGCGTVFELTPATGGGWGERILHDFNNNGRDGYNSQAGLALEANGSLCGTTVEGGVYGDGTVFELTPGQGGGDWTEAVLHSFNYTDGASPFAVTIFDAAGNIYGTTNGGGAYGEGTAFEIKH